MTAPESTPTTDANSIETAKASSSGNEKKQKLSLFVFIDAMGWEVIQKHPHFLKSIAPQRKELKTIFGYSSACDPSIISGMLPNQHGLWSSYYYSPETCPYRWLRFLRFLPSRIMDYHRIRYRLSNLIKKLHSFTGYFQLYNVPFKVLPLFDYAEKKRIWDAGGLPIGESIFDELHRKNIPHYVHNYQQSDEEKLRRLRTKIEDQSIDFAYVSLGKLDALMHAKGTQDPSISPLMDFFQEQIAKLMSTAEKQYRETALYVFTDHGMHDIHETKDVIADVEKLGLKFGKDYVAMYDATMARVWFLNDAAKKPLTELFNGLSYGKVLSQKEQEEFGTYFSDGLYGDLIFLMDSGVQIVPSFMGKNLTPGIHGFHPNDADSAASICSNKELPKELDSIEQIYWLMLKELELEIPAKHPNKDRAQGIYDC